MLRPPILIGACALTACTAPPDELAVPLTVTGTDRFVTAAGIEPVPRDLSQLRAYAFADGRPIELTAADGVVEPAGPGPIYVDSGDLWVVTDEATLDLGRVRLGRADAARPGEPVALAVDLAGLAPWQEADQLQLYAQDVEAWLLTGVPGIEAGATELSVAIDYSGPLVDAGRGDQLWLAQLTSRTIGDDVYSAVDRATVRADADFTAAEPAIAGELEPAPQRSFEVDWRITRFDDARLQVQPVIASSWYDANISSLVAAADHGFYGISADQLTMRVTDQTGRDVSGQFDYGAPFPDDWDSMATFIAWYPVSVRAEPDDLPLILFDTIWIRDLTERLDGARLEPRITAPRALSVGGRDAREPQRGVGRTPVIAWQPPALGSATGYRVTVVSLATGFGVTRELARAEIATALTSIRIPPGAVDPAAAAFAVQVTAVAGPADLARAPHRLSLPHAVASLTSAALAP
jgi:hypothetical protein